MDLVGAWLRQLLKAGTAAALVPAAMVAALVVVLLGAGGLGGLGSLSQLVVGPRISPVEAARADGREFGSVALPRAAEPQRPKPAAVAPPLPPPPPPPPVVPVLPAPPPPPPARTPPPPPPPPPAVAPEPEPEPEPAPRPPPTLAQGVDAVTEGLEQTVGDLGTVLEQIITGIGQALVVIIGPPPAGS